MKNKKLFNYYKKHKKLTLVLAIFAILGFFLPTQFANASIADITLKIFYPAIYAMGAVAQWIALTLLGWAGNLFDYVISPEFNQIPFTKSLFVKNGWIITRNFANSFFMLIMLAIAFSTILRIDIFGINIKKTLPRLVVAALFINFSLVIGGLIIDAGQIIMVTFTHGATSQGSLATFLHNQMQIGSLFAGPDFLEGLRADTPMETLKAVSSVWFGALFMGLAAFAFFMLAIMLIVRIIMLWLLLIFAPLAWLAYIIPGAEQFWKQWWDIFLRQTFFGAIIGFFMYLAAQMAANLSAIQQFNKEVGTGIETGSKFLSNTSFLLQYFTILAMLYLSVIVARRINSIGVNATFRVLSPAKKRITSWAKGASGLAYGATGVPATMSQLKQFFQEKRALHEEKAGTMISSGLGRIPGLGGIGEVARKKQRGLLHSQFKDLTDDDLMKRMIAGQGMEERVATEIFRQRKMKIDPTQFSKLKSAVKTDEGKINLREWAKETKNEHLVTDVKVPDYDDVDLATMIRNMDEKELRSRLNNAEFFQDPRVQAVIPGNLNPKLIEIVAKKGSREVQLAFLKSIKAAGPVVRQRARTAWKKGRK